MNRPDPATPVYLVAELEVHDAEKMRRYATDVKPVLERYGGRILATFPPTPGAVEGDWHPQVLVIQEWPSADAFHSFWFSTDYAPLGELRRSAARSRIVTIEGTDERWPETLAARRPGRSRSAQRTTP